MPTMLHAKHMESCDQLLECYDTEIMEILNEVSRALAAYLFVVILHFSSFECFSDCLAPARQAV